MFVVVITTSLKGVSPSIAVHATLASHTLAASCLCEGCGLWDSEHKRLAGQLLYAYSLHIVGQWCVDFYWCSINNSKLFLMLHFVSSLVKSVEPAVTDTVLMETGSGGANGYDETGIGHDEAGLVPVSINIDEPRWDQNTFVGRLNRFIRITNPLLLLKPTRDFDNAAQLVQQAR